VDEHELNPVEGRSLMNPKRGVQRETRRLRPPRRAKDRANQNESLEKRCGPEVRASIFTDYVARRAQHSPLSEAEVQSGP
jgi:hypothetical protein